MGDPGLVTGFGYMEVVDNELHRIETFEVSGGPLGAANWWYTHLEAGLYTAVMVEDFIVRQTTGRMTQEDIRYAMQGAFMLQGIAYAMGVPYEKIHLIGASEHKTFSGVNGPKAGNKVLQLELAPKTKDGHAMDAASLGLQLLRKEEPEAYDRLVGPLFL